MYDLGQLSRVPPCVFVRNNAVVWCVCEEKKGCFIAKVDVCLDMRGNLFEWGKTCWGRVV